MKLHSHKILILSLFFLTSASRIFSQNSYFENNPVWRLNSQCSFNTPNCISQNDYNYFVGSDTVINSHIYKKIFQYGYGFYTWNGPPTAPPYCEGSFVIGSLIQPFCYLRDTLGMILRFDSPEYCIYDFNMIVGDTLPSCYGSSQVVNSIDTIIINGQIRKRFYLGNGPAQVIIEGMGHEGGFLELLPPLLECANLLVCYSVNDTSYYPNVTANCDVIDNMNDVMENIELKPNPANQYFIINNLKATIENISLYSSLGKLVLTLNSIGNSINVDMSELPIGIYYIRLKSNGNVFGKTLMISH